MYSLFGMVLGLIGAMMLIFISEYSSKQKDPEFIGRRLQEGEIYISEGVLTREQAEVIIQDDLSGISEFRYEYVIRRADK